MMKLKVVIDGGGGSVQFILKYMALNTANDDQTAYICKSRLICSQNYLRITKSMHAVDACDDRSG